MKTQKTSSAKSLKLYDTDQKKRDFLKKGNIVTFKRYFYPRGTKNEGYKQISILRLKKQQGAVKIIGLAYDSDWFESIDALVKAINWDWMETAHQIEQP